MDFKSAVYDSYADCRFQELLRKLKSLNERVINWGGEPAESVFNEMAHIVREMNAYGIEEMDPRVIIERFTPKKKRTPKAPRPVVVEIPEREKSEEELLLEKLVEHEKHIVELLERIGDAETAQAARERYRELRKEFFKPSRFHHS